MLKTSDLEHNAQTGRHEVYLDCNLDDICGRGFESEGDFHRWFRDAISQHDILGTDIWGTHRVRVITDIEAVSDDYIEHGEETIICHEDSGSALADGLIEDAISITCKHAGGDTFWHFVFTKDRTASIKILNSINSAFDHWLEGQASSKLAA